MKRVLSIIMVMALVFTMLPAVYAAESEVIASGTDVAATVAEPITYTWTASANGTLTVTMGASTPGWYFTISDAEGNTVGLPQSGSTEKSYEFTLEEGVAYTFTATGYNTSAWEQTSGNITYTLTFAADDAESGGEVVKSEYEVSETALALGDNSVTMLDTAITTIYVYEPTETGVYTFTAPEGAIVGYWGAGSWFLTNPNSTTNTCEWTCTGVGQSAYIGVSGVEGSFNLNVAKTGNYEVVETPIVVYENKAELSTFTLPEGHTLHSYIDVTSETVYTAVLGDDGYYHLNSADGDIILVDMDYQDIVLSDALKSDRPVMYAYTTDENGNDVKYDIGAAIQEYEAVMDENGYYPLTEDLILFYDTYANGASIYTFYVTGDYNQDNVWMYCMRTVTMPEVTETTEPEVTEPEVTEPEVTEPEVTEPEVTVPESSEPVGGTEIVNESITADSSSKYVYSYTPTEDGTLTVTVGDGSTNWKSDLRSVVGLTFTTINSAEGSTQTTYSASVTADVKYMIRVWEASERALTATPLTVVFTPAGDTTDPETSEPAAEKSDYEVSGTSLNVGSNTLTMLDTAVVTVFKFKPTEAGTYTFTAPEGTIVGNWGSNVSYLTDPNSTTNSCEWTCSSVGQSVFIGVSGVEGQFELTVTKYEEPTEPTESTEPETEPSASETTVPSISDEDVPAGTYYSITIDGSTTYYSTSTGAALNTNLKSITGSAYVKFYQDMTLGSSYTIDVLNGDITLDLNGCTITSAFKAAGCLYVNGGNVTVTDSSAEGSGLLQNTSTGFGIEIYTGSVSMLGGNVQGVQGVKVWASASFDMQGGTASGSSYGINALADSTIAISGGEIIQSTTGTFKYALFVASTANATVNGGYINGTVSGAGLDGKIAGGHFTASFNSSYIASGCELQDNDDSVYLYKVVDPNAETTEPTEPDVSEPEASEPESSEPESSEPEVSEPESSEPEASEPAASGVIASGTDVAATVAEPVTHTWTASANGTLTVAMGASTPGWYFTISDAEGNTVGLPQSGSTEKSYEFTLVEGVEYTFTATGYNTSAWEQTSGNITYTLTFAADDAESGGEVVKSEYEVSETALALGDNSVAMLDTAITTIYVYEPTETGVYTFTAPEGAIVGYWGAGSWFLTNPNGTTNTCEWTCTGVGQSAYIGVSGVEGSFNLNVAKTGNYEVVETPIVVYENKAELSTFTLPEGHELHSYIDVTSDTVYTAVLGDDGYYHLNSADGDIILVDMNYQDIVLSDALKSDRPVMYAYTTDEDGNDVKYDIGAAVQEYEAVMDENGYYPLTEDLILFYDTYANGASIYTFYVTGDYNQDNVWMYCMRTVTFPEVTEPDTLVDQWNLVLNDDLVANFHLNISEENAATTQVAITVGQSSYVYDVADMETTDDGKYVASVHVAAAQMMDQITVQVVGSEAASDSATYTVRQYAETVLADDTLSQYHILIKEMLNYGAAAQTYFDNDANGLANDGITGVGEEEVPEAADPDLSIAGSANGITFYGASLVYQSKVAVRLYFKAESIEGLTFTANGAQCDAVLKDECYMIEVAGISPEDLDDQVTVTVTDAEGNVMSVKYGPMNYIVRMSATGSENLKALLKAMYNYHLAAEQLRSDAA